MSDPDPATPAERLRRIEEETDQLDRDIEDAREAVRHATQADSMAMPGDARGEASFGTVGGDAEEEDEEYRRDEGRAEQDQGGTDRTD